MNTPLEFFNTSEIALDTEFSHLNPVQTHLFCLVLFNGRETILLEREADEEIIAILKHIKEADILVVGHNIKIDVLVLYMTFGILLKRVWCTMNASRILDNGRAKKHPNKKGYFWVDNMLGGKGLGLVKAPHSLVMCLKRFLQVKMDETHKAHLQESFIYHPKGEPLLNEQKEYAKKDVRYLLQLKEEEQKFIQQQQLGNIVNLENQLIPVLVKMEAKGVLIDFKKHQQNIINWQNDLWQTIQKLDTEINRLALTYPQIRNGNFTRKRIRYSITQQSLFGAPSIIEGPNHGNINYSSSAQILELFERLKIPKPVDQKEQSKSGYSIGIDSLTVWLTNFPGNLLTPFVQLLILYQEQHKLLTTYGEKLLQCIDPDGRLRTSYEQTIAETGRIVSRAILNKTDKEGPNGFNLANIPRNNAIRNIFVADPGYKFVDCDMTGQEGIIAAAYSKDPILMKTYKEGFDMHSYLAGLSFSIIFNKPVEIVNEDRELTIEGKKYNMKKELREQHKNVLFAKFYGAGFKRVFEYLASFIRNHHPANKQIEIAKKVSTQLDRALSTLTSYLQKQANTAQIRGFLISSKLGRRRYFPYSETVFGDAMNFGIQGTGAECIKISLIRINALIEDEAQHLQVPEEEIGQPLLTIYDQNICLIGENYLYLVPKIQQIMADSLTYFLNTETTGLTGTSSSQITDYWIK